MPETIEIVIPIWANFREALINAPTKFWIQSKNRNQTLIAEGCENTNTTTRSRFGTRTFRVGGKEKT